MSLPAGFIEFSENIREGLGTLTQHPQGIHVLGQLFLEFECSALGEREREKREGWERKGVGGGEKREVGRENKGQEGFNCVDENLVIII